MSLPDGLRLREATGADLPAIVAMRAAAGWKIHEWALRVALEAPNVRFLAVVDAGDEIVAVGSGAAYGALGFVGNMIVAEGHRRRGIGSHVLRAVLDALEAAGVRRVELYATADGRPLYARHGFEPDAPGSLVRIARGALGGKPETDIGRGRPEELAELASYDAPRFGGDRSVVLAELLNDGRRPVFVARRDGAIAGYAWIRDEELRVGPLVADAPEVAADLLRAVFDWLPDAGELTLNMPTANATGVAWLDALGVELDPWDGRMVRGGDIPRRMDTIYGNAVGALG